MAIGITNRARRLRHGANRGVVITKRSGAGPGYSSPGELLAPKIRVDDVVIWDNLPGHKLQRVINLVEARGATVLFLPPYSPDLNPIEMLWSKLKSIIRKYAPKTTRAFHRAVRKAIEAITKQDLRNWFQHCGF